MDRDSFVQLRNTLRLHIRQTILDLENCIRTGTREEKSSALPIILSELNTYLRVTRLGHATQCRLLEPKDIETMIEALVVMHGIDDIRQYVVNLLCANGIERETLGDLFPKPK